MSFDTIYVFFFIFKSVLLSKLMSLQIILKLISEKQNILELKS